MWKKKGIWLYGLLMGILVIVLRYFEYSMQMRDISTEAYSVFLAVIFLGLGTWVGTQFFRKNKAKEINIEKPLPLPIENALSEREVEVLELLAEGHTNQEIAERLFVSLNTVKTHLSNIYLKLEVKRRTQAVQKARELQIIH